MEGPSLSGKTAFLGRQRHLFPWIHLHRGNKTGGAGGAGGVE